jgi:hypothetical protein
VLETITRKLYVDYPARASRFAPLLGAAASDSIYLTAWPLVALIAPLLAFAFGFSDGAFHWTHSSIWDGRIVAGPGLVFMQMLPLMIVATAVGSLSVELGLLLVLGFALGDMFVAGVHFWGHWRHQPRMWSFFHITIPQLITYLVAYLLVVQPALTARVLAVNLPALPLSRGTNKTVLAVLCAAIQGVMVYAWTFMAPMAVRPYWLWHHAPSSPVTVQYFTSVVNPMLPLIAGGFVLVRALLVAVADQNPQFRRNARTLGERLQDIEARKGAPSLSLTVAGTVIGALLLTLLLSGLLTEIWPQSVIVFSLFLAILALRSIVLPMLPPWRIWVGIAKRIPMLVRWIAMGIGSYYIGRLVLTLPGQSVFLNERTGSFGAEISGVLAGLAFAAILYPAGPLGTRSRPANTVINLRPAIQTAGVILIAFILFHPACALANCVASRCCFTSDWIAAAYIASWIGVGAIFIFFAPEIAFAMRVYSALETGVGYLEAIGRVITETDPNDFWGGIRNVFKEDLRLTAKKFAAFTGETLVGLVAPGVKGPMMEILSGEGGAYLEQQMDSRIDGFFDNVRIGSPGDMASKYLWTIDGRGVNIAPATTPFATPSGTIVDSNISPKAYAGGEAWFGPNNTVHLNTASSRFSGPDASPQQTALTVGFWQHLGYTPSYAAPTIAASSAPTKFWELESIARSVPGAVQAVAAQKSEWSQFADLHNKLNDLINQQDRTGLDQSVPNDLVTEVLNKLDMTLYQGPDGRIRTQQMSSGDQPISAVDVFKKHGGNFLENVLEHGSELVI